LDEHRLDCTDGYPDDAYDTGDEYYKTLSCAPPTRQAHEYSFGFTWQWDNGWGRSGFTCNPNLPYVRALNAMTVLAQLSQVGTDNDYYAYAGGQIEELDVECNGPSAMAVANAGGNATDDFVNLFYRYFYNDPATNGGFWNVTQRAAALVHEARHIARNSFFAHAESHTYCPHDPNSSSQGCDIEYSNSRDLNDPDAGSYSVEVWVLEQFARRNTRAPRYLRDYAVDSANAILGWRFAVPTQFRVPPLPTGAGCLAGQISHAGPNGIDQVCEYCASGLADHTTNTCLPACQRSFVPNANLNGCTCPGGTYFNLRPGPEPWCEGCGYDSVGNGRTCQSCGVGMVPDSARTSCRGCGPFDREALVSGSSTCQNCGTGAVPSADRSQCVPCPRGSTPRLLGGKAVCLSTGGGNLD
jgi:hypothetical protein